MLSSGIGRTTAILTLLAKVKGVDPKKLEVKKDQIIFNSPQSNTN